MANLQFSATIVSRCTGLSLFGRPILTFATFSQPTFTWRGDGLLDAGVRLLIDRVGQDLPQLKTLATPAPLEQITLPAPVASALLVGGVSMIGYGLYARHRGFIAFGASYLVVRILLF